MQGHPWVTLFLIFLRNFSNFRFFYMWLQNTSCLKLIHDSLANKIVGCPMFILKHKLKRLKHEL